MATKAARKRYLQTARGKETSRAQCARWRRDNPEKYAASMRRHDLKRHYGMTPEQWAAMFAIQGGRCAICRASEPGNKKGQWSTDHDHTTGKVRGILCCHCNRMLGGAQDNPRWLRDGAAYLECVS